MNLRDQSLPLFLPYPVVSLLCFTLHLLIAYLYTYYVCTSFFGLYSLSVC